MIFLISYLHTSIVIVVFLILMFLFKKFKKKSLVNKIFESLKSLYSRDSYKSITSKGLYEVWFTMVNDVANNECYWIRYTLMVPKTSSSVEIDKLGGNCCLWLGYFNHVNPEKNFMIKKKYPLSFVRGSQKIDENAFSIVKIGEENEILLDKMSGGFTTENGKKVSWDLKFSNLCEPYYPIPYIGWFLGITNTYVCNGHPNLRISGTILIDKEEKVIKDQQGCQHHTFGDSYKEVWTWFHGNTFVNHPKAFIEVGYKSRIRKGSLGFFTGEKWFLFNTIFTMKKIKEELKTTTHTVIVAEDKNVSIRCEITSPKEAIIGLEYSGPKGNKFYCYNSETANLKVTLVEKKLKKTTNFDCQFVDYETVWDKPQDGLKYLPSKSEDWE